MLAFFLPDSKVALSSCLPFFTDHPACNYRHPPPNSLGLPASSSCFILLRSSYHLLTHYAICSLKFASLPPPTPLQWKLEEAGILSVFFTVQNRAWLIVRAQK